jgi:tetratricopeptide (TPR) repeat protein
MKAMKMHSAKMYACLILTSLLVTSCALFDDVTYTVNPDPLEVHGDSVRVSVTGSVPEKKMNKNAIADLTPTLKWDGGEKQLRVFTVQGENAAGNGTVINSKTGGSFSYTDVIPYQPGMMKSELYVSAKAGKGTNRKELGEAKIADGVIATPYLVQSDDRPVFATDNFVRITKEEKAAQLNYKVNSSKVLRNELKDEDITQFEAFLAQIASNERLKATGVQVDAFASPEGEVAKNDKLAMDRAQSARDAINKMMEENSLSEVTGILNQAGKGEDWEGFRKMMAESDIEDKDLIIRILETYSDVNEREEQIKNLSKAYTEIADDILPKLRRSNMVMKYDVIGYSDEELETMAKSSPDKLNLEELVLGASLQKDLNDQVAAYKKAEARFTDDYRASNNIGAIYLMQGKDSDAEAQFKKADAIESNAITSNNLGIIARRKGDRKAAAEYFRNGLSAGPEAAYNLGIVNMQDGNYSEAVSNMSGVDSFNSALAKMLNGDVPSAQSTLDKSADADTAIGSYLKAVMAARSGDQAGVTTNIAKAISMDASLKERAMKDAEFLNIPLGL